MDQFVQAVGGPEGVESPEDRSGWGGRLGRVQRAHCVTESVATAVHSLISGLLVDGIEGHADVCRRFGSGRLVA
jgi:hypothetical protein